MMNVLVIGGFLGSGKTTLVRQLAARIGNRTDSSSLKGRTRNPDSKSQTVQESIRAVILENEIGDTRVDETYLSASGLLVQNLSAGCACCTLAGETADTLARIQKDLNPEWVILEASGAAIPEKICQAVEKLKLSVRSCVLVDAQRWQRIRVPLKRLLEGQLEGADLVLISKTDLITPSELSLVISDLREHWGEAVLCQASLLEPLTEDMADCILGQASL